jgi:hypothetical protein
MRRLAEFFVEQAPEGRDFGWDTASALRLDDPCEQYLAGQPDSEGRHYFSAGVGAYLGELVVRAGRGRWVYEPNAGRPAVEIANGQRCFPMAKVAKRLECGPEHSIWTLYEYMMTGQVGPDMKLTKREWNA